MALHYAIIALVGVLGAACVAAPPPHKVESRFLAKTMAGFKPGAGGSERQKAALKAKFGDVDGWVSSEIAFLKSCGFNALGAWTEEKAHGKPGQAGRIPYTVFVGPMATHNRSMKKAGRGIFYQNFVNELIKGGVCVGWHWFKYGDNDPTDPLNDPSNRNSNKGLATWDYRRYEPLADRMREINNCTYNLSRFHENAAGGRADRQARQGGREKAGLPLAHDAYITKAKLEGGEREKIGVARHGYVFRLYDDMMAIERREFGEGGSLGEDWVMPLGSFSPHPFSREGLKKAAGEPQFPNGAKLSVKLEKRVGVGERRDSNLELELKTPTDLHISIPLANGNQKCRVYAYEVEIRPADSALVTSSPPVVKAIYAAGVNLGMGHEPNKGVTTLEIGRSELPKGERFVVSVTPLTSVGTRGRPITANVF